MPTRDVRLDKWLQVARVFKTRTQATRACNLGRVRVNGLRAKSHRKLALEDKVEVELGEWTRVLIVRELKDRPVRKEEALRLFEDISLPRPTLDDMERLMRRSPAYRERGKGQPSKRERRQIERWRGRWREV